MTPPRYQLRDGRLTRDGEPVLLHGVVYHPSRTGVTMWREAGPAELAGDLAAIASQGFNTVRLFLYWRDFAPAEDQVHARALERVRACVDEAARHGLGCLVSLLTIFMNGELLDLPWRRGRNPWRDPNLVAAEERYVGAVAQALGDSPGLLGFDLGDEMSAIAPTDAAGLRPEDLAAWYTRLRDAIHRHAPDVLIMQANNATAVFNPSAFSVANAAALDLNAVHGFPSWAPGSIESSVSVKATYLVPFLASVAGAFRPVLVDELGCYGTSDEVAADYLGAAAVSAVANGATGFIVWCWQDLTYAGEPFDARPLERFMGLLRTDGSAKPTMTAVRSAIATTSGLVRRRGAPIALYLPQRLLCGGHSYLDTGGSAIATFYAYLLLKRAHLDFDTVTDGLDGYRLVICPAPTHLTGPDQQRLTAAARAGATVYLSLGDHLHGLGGTDLTGVAPVDFVLEPAGRDRIIWADQSWPVTWPGPGLTVTAEPGAVLATFPDGAPAVVRHPIGRGQVVTCAAAYEPQLDQPGRLAQYPWHDLYRRVAELARVHPTVWCDEPDVEIVPVEPAERRAVLLVNHRPAPVTTTVSWRRPGARVGVKLDGKRWHVVDDQGVR